jgi:HK97 family phage prohead protease
VEPDFGGYATKFGVRCSDGRTITAEAFKHMDGQQIPLLWSHQHNTPENVLGHSILEWRPDGMYCKNFLNETPAGLAAKTVVLHKDIDSMSIYANKLVERNQQVLHGDLIEVSLVHKAANPGARIDFVQIQHGYGDNATLETLSDEAVIYTDAKIELQHAATTTKTFQDVYDSLDSDQRELVNVMVSKALEDNAAQHSDDDKHAADGADDKPDKPDTSTEDGKKDATTEDKDSVVEHSEGREMATRNVFENNKQVAVKGELIHNDEGKVLSHSDLKTIATNVFADLKKGGTFKESVLAHAGEFGITNIEVLFPDAQLIDNKPEWLTRDMAWVNRVIGGTNKLPFSKIRSMHADLTQDEARAKGYIKGTLKKEQFFAITSRTTEPTTIYKKQKLNRDDITDITGFDVVAWIWQEMRFMLLEEIARAILIADGREIDDPDKISETNIRPIAYDDTFYTDVVSVAANINGQDMIDAVLRRRQYYKGTAPTAFMTTSVMMDLLLVRNSIGERIYKTKADVAAALLVQDIVEVPVMENAMRDGAEVQMVLVNLRDYSVGSTRGGEVTTFDQFDIDYNQFKYLIEGRMSGALNKAKTAQVVVRGTGTPIVTTSVVPTFNNSTGVITIPTVTGVTYKVQVAGPLGAAGTTLSAGAQTALTTGQSQAIMAVANTGYYFPHNYDQDWTFTKS